MSTLTGWLGALASAALVAGLAWWAWDLAHRDASGVPVVRALEGPARLAPEDPGGFRADHTGLSVNRIASDEPTAPLADRITLAPAADAVTEADSPAQADDAGAAPVTEGSGSVTDAALRASIQSALEEVQEAAPAAQPGSGIPRPERRPIRPAEADLATRADPGTDIVLASAAIGRRDAADIPPGTRLVQLGAYEDEATALAEWSRLSATFANYLAGKDRVMERADVAGRVFYRLRIAGFEDLADARRFCSTLIAERADCIPVLTR